MNDLQKAHNLLCEGEDEIMVEARKLSAKQKKMLSAHKGVGYFDELPQDVQYSVLKANDYETLEQDADRFLNDLMFESKSIPKLRYKESGKIEAVGVKEILDIINRDRTDTWSAYDESNWREGFDEWESHNFDLEWGNTDELEEGDLPKVNAYAKRKRKGKERSKPSKKSNLPVISEELETLTEGEIPSEIGSYKVTAYGKKFLAKNPKTLAKAIEIADDYDGDGTGMAMSLPGNLEAYAYTYEATASSVPVAISKALGSTRYMEYGAPDGEELLSGEDIEDLASIADDFIVFEGGVSILDDDGFMDALTKEIKSWSHWDDKANVEAMLQRLKSDY